VSASSPDDQFPQGISPERVASEFGSQQQKYRSDTQVSNCSPILGSSCSLSPTCLSNSMALENCGCGAVDCGTTSKLARLERKRRRWRRVCVSSLTPGTEVASLIYAEYRGDTKSDESSRRGTLECIGSGVAGGGRLLPACVCPSKL
jgi:hypothetical protein